MLRLKVEFAQRVVKYQTCPVLFPVPFYFLVLFPVPFYFLGLLGKVVEKRKPYTQFEDYERRFENLTVKYTLAGFKYKSSNWKSLGDQIVKDCFSDLFQDEGTGS